MTLTREDYDSWLADRVTQAVHEALARKAAQAGAAWHDASWVNGSTDPVLLADLRATATICNDIRKLTYEELMRALDEEEE